jgi:hypothetical protein
MPDRPPTPYCSEPYSPRTDGPLPCATVFPSLTSPAAPAITSRTSGPGQLAFLSPRVQAAIQDGTLPPDLTLMRLLSTPVPLDWDAQEKLYGI